jgi:hypothetical protein
LINIVSDELDINDEHKVGITMSYGVLTQGAACVGVMSLAQREALDESYIERAPLLVAAADPTDTTGLLGNLNPVHAY